MCIRGASPCCSPLTLSNALPPSLFQATLKPRKNDSTRDDEREGSGATVLQRRRDSDAHSTARAQRECEEEPPDEMNPRRCSSMHTNGRQGRGHRRSATAADRRGCSRRRRRRRDLIRSYACLCCVWTLCVVSVRVHHTSSPFLLKLSRMLSRVLRALVLSSALLVSGVSAAVNNDFRSTDHTLSVEFGTSGGSGSIKVAKNVTGLMPNAPSGEREIEIRMRHIYERNAQGVEVQYAQDYAHDPENWYGPTAATVDGVSAQLCTYRNTTLNTDRGNGGTIEIKAYIFSVAGTILNGGESISVPKNALKLTFDINAWPFLNATNTLDFSLELKLDAVSSAATEETTDFDSGRQRRMNWGGLALDVVTSAIVDGVLVPVANPVLTTTGTSTFVKISLPHFGSHITYDPTVSVGSSLPNSAATTGASALVAVVLAAFAAVMQNKL